LVEHPRAGGQMLVLSYDLSSADEGSFARRGKARRGAGERCCNARSAVWIVAARRHLASN
jgi:hypothetical protein